MPTTKRGGPKTMRELLERDGGAAMSNPDRPCPKCGAMPKPFEVTTPRFGWVLTFWMPCTQCKARP